MDKLFTKKNLIVGGIILLILTIIGLIVYFYKKESFADTIPTEADMTKFGDNAQLLVPKYDTDEEVKEYREKIFNSENNNLFGGQDNRFQCGVANNWLYMNKINEQLVIDSTGITAPKINRLIQCPHKPECEFNKENNMCYNVGFSPVNVEPVAFDTNNQQECLKECKSDINCQRKCFGLEYFGLQ